jgi:hypothetical protein
MHIAQRLDNLPNIKAHIRRNLIVAMQRLSKKTNLYPTFFALNGVTEIGSDPVAARGFADIYKGRFEGWYVCLKMFPCINVAMSCSSSRVMIGLFLSGRTRYSIL